MSSRSSILRKALVTGALVTGLGFGAAGIASAATASAGGSTAASSAASASSTSGSGSSGATAPGNSVRPAPPRGGDPASMTHGPDQTPLTGTDLQKATAAAEAAVPGATVVRAEATPSGPSAYEVHMKKTDGSHVTVELDSNFKVIKTVAGFGAGPGRCQPPGPGTNQPPGSGTNQPPGSAASQSAAA